MDGSSIDRSLRPCTPNQVNLWVEALVASFFQAGKKVLIERDSKEILRSHA